MPKPKDKSKNPSFLHSYIKSNPENIKLKEYVNQDGIKRVILFPEGKQLGYEERLDLGASLLLTCARYTPDTSGKRFPYVFTRNVKQISKMKLRRYQAWRRKQT